MAEDNYIPDSGMISAVTGAPVEGLLYEPRRKKISRYSAIGFYVILLLILYLMPAALPDVSPPEDVKLPNLVFVFEEGPGGGGGGGGDESPEPPSIQKVAGEDQARLALSVEEPEDALVYEDEEAEEPEEEEDVPPEEEPEPENEIKAPLVAQAPNDFDQKGVLEGPEQPLENGGEGENGGAGSGSGNGIGEGDGQGIGPGWGGGIGGGAYRMGSGIEPPQIRRQVRPDYTDHALSRKIQGTVLLEIIILKDGTVGPVRVLQSLDPGLDQKAVEAARKYLFFPGKLRGEPVAVVAELVVEFSLL